MTARSPARFIFEHDLSHLPKFDISVDINERVVAWMEYFQGPGRGHFRRYLERSGRYIPLMQEILVKEGMPRDLIYIALIESGFNTQARSWASAVGPWQFIQSTGRRYGLRIDGWVDERRDPYKSTRAAARYFRDLYGEFGDWYLAMAGYNGGEGRVRQAIEMTGTKNFWAIAEDRRALRPETRDYVPKFIAAAIMAKEPGRFGFGGVAYKPPFDYDKGVVETQTDISAIAKCAGATEDEIIDLNPHLVRGATPPEEHDYEVRVPKGSGKRFHEMYAALPREERIQVVRHVVGRGESLAMIARRYGVSPRLLAEANGLRSARGRLHRGTALVIPSGAAAARYVAAQDDRSTPRRSSAARHTVRRGETAAGIARRYGITARELLAWNSLSGKRPLRAGAKLVVRAAPPAAIEGEAGAKEHRVKKGETLQTIARRYGVTARHLMALNGIGPKGLKAGVTLVVRQARGEAKAAGVPVRLASLDKGIGEIEAAKDAGEANEAGKVAPGNMATGKKAAQHKVQKGETLGAIAKKYGVSVGQLMAMNGIRDARAVRAGTSLAVGEAPKAKAKNVDIAVAEKGVVGGIAAAEKGAVKLDEDRVEKVLPAPPSQNMTLASNAPLADARDPGQAAAGGEASLSDQLPFTPADVGPGASDSAAARSAEGAAAGAPRPQGGEARERAAPQPEKGGAAGRGVEYKVKSGDTLWDIARRHKVSIAQIQQWNNLGDPSSVRPGTVLTIRK